MAIREDVCHRGVPGGTLHDNSLAWSQGPRGLRTRDKPKAERAEDCIVSWSPGQAAAKLAPWAYRRAEAVRAKVWVDGIEQDIS